MAKVLHHPPASPLTQGDEPLKHYRMLRTLLPGTSRVELVGSRVLVDDPAMLEERYRQVCELLPRSKVEIIHGRIVVREVATIDHAQVVFDLLAQLMPSARERGWRILTGVRIFLGVQADRYEPDLVVTPPNARRWDPSHLYAEECHLVTEVVSPSSIEDDHSHKPARYARSGIPLYLVIDTFRQTVRLLSEPGEEGYGAEVEVAFGKPLELPSPWNLTLDTVRFAEG